MNYLKSIFLMLGFGLAFLSYSQTKTITVQAGQLMVDPELEEGAKTFLRNKTHQVHFIHEGVDMWCDKAIYYEDQDFIEAYSNVVMKQGDTINMTAKYVEYSGKTQLAYARGEVVLTDPKTTLTTDTLYFDRARQLSYYNTKGKVVRDSSGTITSQIGNYYMKNKKYQFVEDVVLVNPDYTMKTERLDFYSNNGHAFTFGPSTIVGEDSKIYSERGFYDTKNDIGSFERNAKIDYDNRSVEGDSLYFDRNKNFASATNNIIVTDTINKSIVKGHYAEVFKEQDSVFITKRAYAITEQEQDSIYIRADTLMVTGKPEHRITRGYYNVRIYKSDMAGKSDSIHVDQKSGITKMINLSRLSSKDAFAKKRKPILWNMGNQMTGDSIHLISNVKTEKLDSLKVFNNAFLISQDTLGVDNYNQVKGKELIGLFRDNELYNVDINKNAEVINFIRGEDNELIGIDKSKSGRINLQLTGNYIEEVRLINRIDGELFPESQFPKNGKRLKDFDWRGDEELKSVDDLFKDDPPLVLPKIQGLEDYIPPLDYVDEEVDERIKKAGKATPNKKNKAARNLPQKQIKKTKEPSVEDISSIKSQLKKTKAKSKKKQ